MIFNLTYIGKTSLMPVVIQISMEGKGFGDTSRAEITLPKNKISKYYETI